MSDLPTKAKNIAGQRFGSLTALEYVRSSNGAIWSFACDCGKLTEQKSSVVIHGRVKSCGCSHEQAKLTSTIPIGYVFQSGLTVVRHPESGGKDTPWEFLCYCGAKFSALISNVRKGNTRSCGCRKRKVSADMCRTHGKSSTSEYCIWQNMVRRCHDENNPAYHNYGGRGVTVCERWHTFENFFADMGVRPPGGTLDRTNNDLGYSPENCRWASRKEQARNQRTNRSIEINGVSKLVCEWAEISGVSASLLIARKFKFNWPDSDLLKPAWSVKRHAHR